MRTDELKAALAAATTRQETRKLVLAFLRERYGRDKVMTSVFVQEYTYRVGGDYLHLDYHMRPSVISLGDHPSERYCKTFVNNREMYEAVLHLCARIDGRARRAGL